MKSDLQIKVLVIPSWYPPNGGYFFKEHSGALAVNGIKVDVLAGVHTSLKSLTPSNLFNAFRTNKNSEGTFNEFERKYWIIPLFEKLNFAAWTAMMMQFFRWYLKRYGKPDVIIAHSAIWAGWVAKQIREKYKIPFLIVEHRSRFVYNTPEARALFKPWYVPYLKKAYGMASKIVTVSDSLQPKIKELVPNCNDKITSIPNMVDTDFFCMASAPFSEKFTFFSLGSLENVKGMDTLIEAFRIVNEKMPGHCRLIIGGKGSQLKILQRLAAKNNLNNFISFVGQLDRHEVRRQMHRAHAFVLASRYEAFGVVFIEAMSCGLPVIGSSSGGPHDFVNKKVGMMVPIQHPAGLAEAMIRMVQQYSFFNRDFIRQYAISNFSKETIANKYFKILKEIL
ncbi:MAG TPA: glycosyltransferase [Bacteroidales bacterium]|nr:glycosyltransferase [Bacteroidales bacterium]